MQSDLTIVYLCHHFENFWVQLFLKNNSFIFLIGGTYVAYLCEFEYVLAIAMAERNIFRSMDIYILDYGFECAWSKLA